MSVEQPLISDREIAAHRFGYSEAPAAMSAFSSAPKAWLKQQLKPLQFANVYLGKPVTTLTVVNQWYEFRQLKKKGRKKGSFRAKYYGKCDAL